MSKCVLSSIYLSNGTITYHHGLDSGSSGGSRHAVLDKTVESEEINLILLEEQVNLLFTGWLKSPMKRENKIACASQNAFDTPLQRSSTFTMATK